MDEFSSLIVGPARIDVSLAFGIVRAGKYGFEKELHLETTS
jgi:hypothetical protein